MVMYNRLHVCVTACLGRCMLLRSVSVSCTSGLRSLYITCMIWLFPIFCFHDATYLLHSCPSLAFWKRLSCNVQQQLFHLWVCFNNKLKTILLSVVCVHRLEAPLSSCLGQALHNYTSDICLVMETVVYKTTVIMQCLFSWRFEPMTFDPKASILSVVPLNHTVLSELSSLVLWTFLKESFLFCFHVYHFILVIIWVLPSFYLCQVHGRSREQRYTKVADWNYIKTCVDVAKPLDIFGNQELQNVFLSLKFLFQ